MLPSLESTSNTTSVQQVANVQNGPLIFNTTSPLSFRMSNFGFNNDHFCLTFPITFPGGDDTSISCKQQENKQELHLRGRCTCMSSFPA